MTGANRAAKYAFEPQSGTDRATKSAFKPPSGANRATKSDFNSFTGSWPSCSANAQPLVHITDSVASLWVERVALACGPSSKDAAAAQTCSTSIQSLLV